MSATKTHDPDEWIQFTKLTNDPKLAWLEFQLDDEGIEHRRHGESFHAANYHRACCYDA